MNNIFSKIAPFIAIGIFLVLLVVGFVLFSYLLIFGAIIGLILFGISWVYNKFFVRRRPQKVNQHRSGRTIDHDSRD